MEVEIEGMDSWVLGWLNMRGADLCPVKEEAGIGRLDIGEERCKN